MARATLLIAIACASLAAGCDRCSSAQDPALTGPVQVPAGWVETKPEKAMVTCANRAAAPWELDAWPGLTAVEREREDARRIELTMSDGVFVGSSRGEWGGSLMWTSADGRTTSILGNGNVRALYALGADEVASVEGLSHMGKREGGVHWVERGPLGAWQRAHAVALDDVPEAVGLGRDGLYVITSRSLTRVRSRGVLELVQPIDWSTLTPTTLAEDAEGHLWIGTRWLVVRFTPSRSRGDAKTGYDARWFIQARCAVTRTEEPCRCDP